MGVSVVIPTYNAGAFIDEAIRSALSQDYPPDEIIVVDDGSTDRDYKELESLGGRLCVIRQGNRGVSAARNVGFARARQEYVAILDADDVWISGKLRAQMAHLSGHPDCDAVFCLGLNWEPDDDGSTWTQPAVGVVGAERAPQAVRLHYRDFLCGIPVATSTMVVKKAAWEALGGYDESMRYGEDQEFNMRLSREYHVDVLNATGMLYRRHRSSATARIQDRNHWAELIEGAIARWGLIDRWGVSVDRAELARHLAQLRFLHGYQHFWYGSFAIARREFGRALAQQPFTPKYLGYLFASSVPGLGVRLRAGLRARSERALSTESNNRPVKPD
jgi:glycosyltransferase involved in cell wall biosynthesis